MPLTRTLLCAWGIATLAVLTACGGTSVHFDVDWPPAGGLFPPGPVDAYGVLDESGAVTVVGVRYDTSAAQVTANGRPVTVAELRAGQIVHVVGTIHQDRVTGTALRVDSEAALIGPVDSLTPGDGSFVAMGQVVRTDADTVLDPLIAPSLAWGIDVGTRVQIHGWRNEYGEIEATCVALDATSPEVQVLGLVAGHDPIAARFAIGGLPVSYGGASHIDLGGGSMTDLMAVVVRGVDGDGVLFAREIRAVRVQLVHVFGLP